MAGGETVISHRAATEISVAVFKKFFKKKEIWPAPALGTAIQPAGSRASSGTRRRVPEEAREPAGWIAVPKAGAGQISFFLKNFLKTATEISVAARWLITVSPPATEISVVKVVVGFFF